MSGKRRKLVFAAILKLCIKNLFSFKELITKKKKDTAMNQILRVDSQR